MPERVQWILRHLRRDRTTIVVAAGLDDVVQRMKASLTDPAAVDRDSRAALRASGFFSGSVIREVERASFKVTAYRPNEWFGRLTPALDPDKMAKPALVGEASADTSGTRVRYEVTAYGTAVSSVVLVALGVLLLIAGAIVSIVHPMPMPSLGFLLLVIGGVCLVFVFLIWQVVDKAILDEASLNEWLPKVIGEGGLAAPLG
jgi:hypothetical protein